jgi:hypothetical protein
MNAWTAYIQHVRSLFGKATGTVMTIITMPGVIGTAEIVVVAI